MSIHFKFWPLSAVSSLKISIFLSSFLSVRQGNLWKFKYLQLFWECYHTFTFIFHLHMKFHENRTRNGYSREVQKSWLQRMPRTSFTLRALDFWRSPPELWRLDIVNVTVTLPAWEKTSLGTEAIFWEFFCGTENVKIKYAYT